MARTCRKARGREDITLKYNDTVILVGAGPIKDAIFESVSARGHFFVGVDGGGDALLARGVIPDAVIGDMDSLSDATKSAIGSDKIIEISEQDSTDFDKTVRSVSAPLILAIGFTGARLDHELAALHVLVRYADRPVIIVGEEDVTIHVPANLALTLTPGTRLSLFPLDAVTVAMDGLRWSFDALALHPARKIGTSNVVSEAHVTLRTDAPGLLLILPRDALDPVIAALGDVDFPSLPR